MNIIKYKYYITYTYISSTSTVEVHPLGVDGLKIKFSGKDGQIFKRRELTGDLIFIDQPSKGYSDYTLFKNIDASAYDKCSEITLEIKRSCDNGTTYENFWDGYFSVTDGKFDLDKCTFNVSVTTNDEYRCYVEGNEEEVNLAGVQASANVKADIYTQYEFYICRDTLGNCNASRPFMNDDTTLDDTWLLFHTEELDVGTANAKWNNIYYREVAIVACLGGVATSPSGSGWKQDFLNFGDSSFSGACYNGLSKWVRTPVTVVTNNPNPAVSAGNCETEIAQSRLAVTKQSTAQTPVIVGKSTVYSNFISNHSEFYSVKYPKANATYLWSVTGGGISVVGSATGTTVEINIAFAAGGIGRSVDLVETTSCGASSTVSQALIATTGFPLNNSEVEQIGNSELCIGETALYTFNTKTGKTCVVTGGTGTATFNTIDNKTFELTGLTEGTISLSWQGGNYLDATNNPVVSITIKNKKATEPVQGDATVCNNSQAYYSIPETDLASYNWSVDGGTILSGQNTHEILVQWNGIDGVGYVYIEQTFNCTCNWVKIIDCAVNGDANDPPFYWCPDSAKEIINNSTFNDVLNYLKDAICPSSGDIVSDFFEWNPVGDTYGYVAGINYVTGETNKLTYLSLIPIRAAVYGFTSDLDFVQPKPDETISWKQIEEILRECFNAYWFIENGVVRIEHISWFQRIVTFDLTDSFYRKYSVGKNIFSYDKIKAPKYERFKWKQAVNTDFIGAEISYSGSCLSKEESTKVANRGINYITTDLIYVNTLGITAGMDGFVMTVSDSNFNLLSEAGKITGIILPNAHLSWANLHYNYHRYNRVLINGNMNLIPTTFITARKFKQQEDVNFPYCCSDLLSPLTDLYRTLVGDGIMDDAEHDLKTDIININLLHDL